MEGSQENIETPYFIKLKSQVELLMRNYAFDSEKRREEVSLFLSRYMEKFKEDMQQLLGDIRKDLSILRNELKSDLRDYSLETTKRKEDRLLFRKEYLERLQVETNQFLGQIRKDLAVSKNEVKAELQRSVQELKSYAQLESQRRNKEFIENQKVVKETLRIFMAELKRK